MAKSHNLTAEQARQLLRYDRKTGKLYWIERAPSLFSGRKRDADVLARGWNTKFAGREALNSPHGSGYLQGSVNNVKQFAHRVIWLIETGSWPAGEIDHDNGAKWDNRWGNLLDRTHAENTRNAAGKSTNTSGHTGVCPRRGKWLARITHDGVDISLGTFATFEEACRARRAGALKYGFTERHGELAKTAV